MSSDSPENSENSTINIAKERLHRIFLNHSYLSLLVHRVVPSAVW